MRDAGAYAADGGYLWRSMWILWMTSSLSSHSTSASVSELSRLVTHTAVSSPKCNSEKRPLSNSVAFRTLFKWHRYCGILKIHIVRKINTGIRYEPVYRPAPITFEIWIFMFKKRMDSLQGPLFTPRSRVSRGGWFKLKFISQYFPLSRQYRYYIMIWGGGGSHFSTP